MTSEEAREAVREAYDYGDPEYANEVIKALEQEPCDITTAFQLGMAFGFGEKHNEMDKVIDELKKVITPQPKTGHWVNGEYCSECGCDVPAYIIDWKWQKDMDAKYCPNCGAKMGGGRSMTSKERYETLIETGEFDFIKDMPKDQFWKLAFFIFYVYGNERYRKEKERQEPCEDAVSRKDIYFKLTNGAYPNETTEQFIDRLVKELKALPPVTPKGVTITDFADKCRECGKQKKGRGYTDRDEFEEDLADRLYDSGDYDETTDEEFDAIVKAELAKYEPIGKRLFR